jgi:hypothetical protein
MAYGVLLRPIRQKGPLGHKGPKDQSVQKGPQDQRVQKGLRGFWAFGVLRVFWVLVVGRVGLIIWVRWSTFRFL